MFAAETPWEIRRFYPIERRLPLQTEAERADLRVLIVAEIAAHSPRPMQLVEALCPPPRWYYRDIQDALAELLSAREVELTSTRQLVLPERNGG